MEKDIKSFFRETITEIVATGHFLKDVLYVTDGENYTTIETFLKEIEGYKYDSGYGSEYINLDLKIVFSNGDFLERDSYDGAEYWSFVEAPDLTIPPLSYISVKFKYDERGL